MDTYIESVLNQKSNPFRGNPNLDRVKNLFISLVTETEFTKFSVTFGTGRLICSELVEAGQDAHAIKGGMFTFDCDDAKMPHKPTFLFFVGDIVVIILEHDDQLTLVLMSEQDYISNMSFIEKPQLTATFEDRGSSVMQFFNRWVDLIREQQNESNHAEGFCYPVSVGHAEGEDTLDGQPTVSVEVNFEQVGASATTYSDSSSSYSGD